MMDGLNFRKLAIVTVGVPCSGKSTWADEFVAARENWVKIERDEIRMKLFGLDDYSLYRHCKDNEQLVTNCFNQLLQVCADGNLNVVSADTNINPKFRKQLLTKLEDLGYDVKIKKFHVSLEEALERNKHRDGKFIPEDIIQNMQARFIDQFGE